jgi:atypical dual specificity phosphatase
MVDCLRRMRKRIVNFFAHAIQSLFTYIMNSRPAHEVVPGLWLGNRAAAHDLDFLRQQNITTIFNCTKDIPFKQGAAPRMYRIPLDDNLEPEEIRNLETWAWETAYKVAREIGTGNRTLVHCMAGMQRSAAVVAIYLVAKYRCTTDEAIAYIKAKRPVAFLGNTNFYKSIKGFEDSLRRMIAEKDAYSQFPKLSLP